MPNGQSLDPINSNMLEKKQVGVPAEHRLQYYPNCTVILMTQPLANINERLVSKGSLRRFLIVKTDIPIDERMDAVTGVKFLVDSTDVDKKIWDEWIESNKNLMKRKLRFNGAEVDFELINQHLRMLKKRLYGEETPSEEVKEFMTDNLFNIKYNIFKMAAVRAVIEQPDSSDIVITKQNIELAILDYDLIWKPLELWIRQNMIITDNKPPGWKDHLHGWVIRGLEKGDMLQANVVNEYVKTYGKKDLAEGSLKKYINTAIRDLKKWRMIFDISSGDKNGKKLSLNEPESKIDVK